MGEERREEALSTHTLPRTQLGKGNIQLCRLTAYRTVPQQQTNLVLYLVQYEASLLHPPSDPSVINLFNLCILICRLPLSRCSLWRIKGVLKWFNEIHLSHSQLVREQCNTPESGEERKEKRLCSGFFCVLLNGLPALSKWGLSFRPWWGYLFPFYPHASPRLCWLLPTWENGLDDLLLCSSQQIKHKPKNLSKLNKSPLGVVSFHIWL